MGGAVTVPNVIEFATIRVTEGLAAGVSSVAEVKAVETSKQSAFANLIVAFLIFGGVLALSGWAGPWLFFRQVFHFLQFDEWVSVSLFDLFAGTTNPRGPSDWLSPINYASKSWLVNPTEWFGLHRLVVKVLDFFPVSVFFSVLFVSALNAIVEAVDAFRKSRTERQ